MLLISDKNITNKRFCLWKRMWINVKSEKNSKSSTKVITQRGKNKIIKLKDFESIMEGNTIDIPYLMPYNRKKIKDKKGNYIKAVDENGQFIKNGKSFVYETEPPITSATYIWTTDGIERKIKVNCYLGVPTLKDKRVLRALQDIFIWSKSNNGKIKLKTKEEDITEEDLIIDFHSITNIAHAMGFESKNVSTQQRAYIRESIERLASTEIITEENGGIYNPIEKKYITSRKAVFKFIDKMEEYEYYDCSNCKNLIICEKFFSAGKSKVDVCIERDNLKLKYNHTKIKLSKDFYLSLANNYAIYYNRDNANKIKNYLSENIYLISRKWTGKGCVSRASIQKYIDRLVVSENQKDEKYKRFIIREAIRELDKYDFVEVTVDKKNIVTIKHLDKINHDKELKDVTMLKDKYNTFATFKLGMEQIGFSDEEFNELMDNHIQKINYLKALLRYVVIKTAYDKKIKASEFYLNCLNANIELNEKYYS